MSDTTTPPGSDEAPKAAPEPTADELLEARMKEWKARWAKVRTEFEQELDELKLKAHLGREDAKDEWDRVESRFRAFSRDLDALTLGDEKAASLGVPPARMRQILFAVTSLATAGCVACAGVISFVGLLVPHLMRPLTGPGHRTLLPASAIGGAALLTWADLLARTAIRGPDLPVGVITGLLGCLFLLGLLLKGRGFRFF